MGVDDELGTVESGKAADLVLVDGDPYEFDTLADRIDGVWQRGVRVV
jgi:imidazolonepropionase-like amidohydrolase